MNKFPKKYKPQELKNRAKTYKNNSLGPSNKESILHPSFLPTAKKITYHDLFLFYIKDFFCKIQDHQKNKSKKSEHIFLFSNDTFENFSNTYIFFNKKKQTLLQTGIEKCQRRIASITKKNINSNNKILSNYFSGSYKFFLEDSSFYTYLITKFREFIKLGKISENENIRYRSFNLQTSIPNKYIVRKNTEIPKYTLRYFIGTKGEALYVNIENIDLCCGDVALLVHPKDRRFNKYIGKKAIIPLCNRQIPIIGYEDMNITLDSGIKRVCPCENQESTILAQKLGLPTDIRVFDQQGLYTNHIHESAFIGQEREKYYKNIEGFIRDIGNIVEEKTETKKIPYLKFTNEHLTPYKINEITIDLKSENEKLLNDIFEGNLHFSFIEENFGNVLNEIKELQEKINILSSDTINEEEILTLKNNIFNLKGKVINEIKKYLPEKYVINNQIQSGRRIPLIKEGGCLKIFDIENLYQGREENETQKCFDFTILSLIRIGTLGTKNNTQKSEIKLCRYEKLFTILFQNEKKIQNFVKQLQNIDGKDEERKNFIKTIQNLMDENNPSKNDCEKLIKNSKFLKKEGDRLLFNHPEYIFDDYFNADFIQLSSSCYINEMHKEISDKIIYFSQNRVDVFEETLLQYLFLGKSIYKDFIEISYNESDEFLGDKQLSKLQIEQSQRDIFQHFGESPIRLTYLTKNTHDQKEIILNSIFLKQIWNAVRLCIQKGFLPTDIKTTLHKKHEDFDNLDLYIICKLNELYESRNTIKNFKDYISFFLNIKSLSQNLFFSRYLEIQKSKKTSNVQVVCSYFFNFLLTVLYPLVPEFTNALGYISERDFIIPLEPINVKNFSNNDMHMLYDIFIKIKNIKIESGIKQHEHCNLFIKSTPTLGEIFEKYEQIFKNYFHIKEIVYLRLHEKDPLGYEIHSDNNLSIGIQQIKTPNEKNTYSIEKIENDIKNLDDKLDLLRQRIQLLPEGEQRSKTEEEYAKTKEEMENLNIKYSLLSNK